MKMPAFKVTALSFIVSSSMLLGGCSTVQNMNKQDIGTWVGGIGGGALCLYATKNSSVYVKVTAGTVCAGIGALLGNAIGQTLDQRDQAALQAKAQEALNSNKAGVTTWKSPTSGATAKLEVSKPFTKTENVSVKRNMTVQPVAQMTKIDGAYLTTKGANVRSSPSTAGDKLAFLPAQTEFTAIGQAGDWIAVGRKGVLVGYVSADLVQSKAVIEQKVAAKLPAPKATESGAMQHAEPTVVPALKLDDISSANQPEMAKLVEQPVVAEKVEATTTCKNLKSTVTNDKGKSDTSTSVQCKNPVVDAWADA